MTWQRAIMVGLAGLLALANAVAADGVEPGKKKREQQRYYQVGKWLTPNSATRRFDTPLGALYRFNPATSYAFPFADRVETRHVRGCRCRDCRPDESMSSVQCEISSKIAGQRFLMLEFQIRQFPGFQGWKHRNLEYIITFSHENSVTADYKSLFGMVRNEQYTSLYQSAQARETMLFAPRPLLGRRYLPRWEPETVRMIFDTNKDGVIYLMRNGALSLIGRYEDRAGGGIEAIRNIGICMMGAAGGELEAVWVELSVPRLTAFSEPERLAALLRDEFQPYPYALFAEKAGDSAAEQRDLRKLRITKNPDFLYYRAMEQLYGPKPEPEFAVATLRKLLSERHVGAAYQLALCYWRGYGVAPDEEMARKYLRRAADSYHSESIALLGLLYLRESLTLSLLPQELLESIYYEKIRNNMEKRPKGTRPVPEKETRWTSRYYLAAGKAMRIENASLDCHDIRAFRQWFSGCVIGALEYSPRLALEALWHFRVPGATPADLREHWSTGRIKKQREDFRRFSQQHQVLLPVLRFEPSANENDYCGISVDFCRWAAANDFPVGDYLLALQYEREESCGMRPDGDPEIEAALTRSAEQGYWPARFFLARRTLLRGGKPSVAREFLNAKTVWAMEDNPWWGILHLALQQPERPDLKWIMARNFDAARKMLEEQKTPEAAYLLALLKLMDSQGELATWRKKISLDDQEAYTLENFAGMTGVLEYNADAQYRIGKLLLEIPSAWYRLFKDQAVPGKGESVRTRAVAWLEKAATAGHLRAGWILSREANTPKEALRYLEPLCAAGIGEAWVRKGELLLAAGRRQEALDAFERGGKCGAAAGYGHLARLSTDRARKMQYYEMFRRNDLRARLLDPVEVYSPKHSLRRKWISCDLLTDTGVF